MVLEWVPRYNTAIDPAESYTIKVGGGGGSIFYVYVDGVLLQKSSTTTVAGGEERQLQVHSGAVASNGAEAAMLQILSVAMGMSNGGSIDNKKGITGNVTVNGQDLIGVTWQHQWLMSGEEKRIFEDATTSAVPWAPAANAANASFTNIWLRARFDLPPATPSATTGSFMHCHRHGWSDHFQ